MTEDLFWPFLCMCYLVGGITIGWLANEWKNRRKPKRSGTGRWDYRNRRYPDGDNDGEYFK